MKIDVTGGCLTELRARGYAVLPAPRTVELKDGSVCVNSDWRIALTGVAEGDIAVRTLQQAFRENIGQELPVVAKKTTRPASAPASGPFGDQTIRLSIQPGAVATATADGRDEQAYSLTLSPNSIELTGNALSGLFYGVQTLAQLLEGPGGRSGDGYRCCSSKGTVPGVSGACLPEGKIVDWPRYELRVLHWDTKHHQDRMETLKRYLDWSARFKINAIAFELEDKFAYPSHPVIGAPQALTPQQLRELVVYGLERHIQIIPNVQAPAHMGYVLKHPEFAHLKCDGSNYQICMDEPEARKLIFDMYDDLCQVLDGVKYFHVSTDEVYYAGICEKFRKPYNPVNRSLTFVDFTNAARDHLAKHGKRIIIWAEYPLLTEHVKLLAPDILDGIIGGGDPKFIEEENKRGIRQFAYCPIQGAELLFPSYFPSLDSAGHVNRGRLAEAAEATTRGKAAAGKPIGSFAAAWDDSGLHDETFWLGWASMAAGGWSPGAASVEQITADFMDIYYGRGVADMVDVYRQLQDGARWFESAWDMAYSNVRGPAYGYSAAKRPVTRSDWTLTRPALPAGADLAVTPGFRSRYAKLIEQTNQQLPRIEVVIAKLQENMTCADHNRYNLEVFLSLAYLQRQLAQMVLALAESEDQLVAAHAQAKAGQPAKAVQLMVEAHKKTAAAVAHMYRTYGRLVKTWEKSLYPKNADVGDKKFLHVMDDVKDHFADRRRDLSYMIAPQESMDLPGWLDGLSRVIADYAKANGQEVKGLAEKIVEN